MKKYEDVTDVVIVLEGTPTGKVLYNGVYRGIPKTRIDTFISQYHNLLKQGRKPLGIITGDMQKDPIDFYINAVMKGRGLSEDSINLYKCENTRITLDDAIEVKKFILEEELENLPCYLVTTEEHMRHRARNAFEKTFGEEIEFIPIKAPWGVEGLERIKVELHEVIGRYLDWLSMMNVRKGDHKMLNYNIEKFWPLRKLVRKSQKIESIGRRH